MMAVVQSLYHEASLIEVFSADEIHSSLALLSVDLLIIDYDLCDFSHLDDFIAIRRQYPELSILIVTENTDPKHVKMIVDGGITNYILKSSQEADVMNALKAAVNKKKYFAEEVLDILLGKPKPIGSDVVACLTKAEIEIVKLIVQGFTTKEIAVRKVLSFHTIITHRKNIFRKLKINSTSELVMYAVRSGIIDTMDYVI